MSYIGENGYFSFRDGGCELLKGDFPRSAAFVRLGRILAARYGRFAAACRSFGRVYELYALCCGISESGKDVYVCENADAPSFRYGFPLLSADCGIYVGGSGENPEIKLFGADRFPLSDKELAALKDSGPAEPAAKNGRIVSFTSFRDVYLNSASDAAGFDGELIPAGVSCGNKDVRALWLNFFTGESDELVFQVSDDGSRVNAYSKTAGFVSCEKLTICFAASLMKRGRDAYLPDRFHYAADSLEKLYPGRLLRFDENDIPPEAAAQRFLTDPLYTCLSLARDPEAFAEILSEAPVFASSRREICFFDPDRLPVGKWIPDCGGRVSIAKSGKNRIALTAQAFSAETASELCCSWTEKLRRSASGADGNSLSAL